MSPKLGRPPLFEGPATKRIHLRVTILQHEALQRVASENHAGISTVVRDAVNSYVADYDENPGRLPFPTPRRR